MIYLSLPLSLFVPIFPWIALLAWDVGRSFSGYKLIWLVISSIFLELWWGKPFGEILVILSSFALAMHLIKRWWPFDNRVLLGISLILAILVVEVALKL